jgi:hypothetical protein
MKRIVTALFLVFSGMLAHGQDTKLFPAWFAEVANIPPPAESPDTIPWYDRFKPTFEGVYIYEIRLNQFMPTFVQVRVKKDRAMAWVEEQGKFTGNLVLADFSTGTMFQWTSVQGNNSFVQHRLGKSRAERGFIRSQIETIQQKTIPDGSYKLFGKDTGWHYTLRNDPDYFEFHVNKRISNPLHELSEWLPIAETPWLPLVMATYAGNYLCIEAVNERNKVRLHQYTPSFEFNFPVLTFPEEQPTPKREKKESRPE